MDASQWSFFSTQLPFCHVARSMHTKKELPDACPSLKLNTASFHMSTPQLISGHGRRSCHGDFPNGLFICLSLHVCAILHLVCVAFLQTLFKDFKSTEIIAIQQCSSINNTDKKERRGQGNLRVWQSENGSGLQLREHPFTVHSAPTKRSTFLSVWHSWHCDTVLFPQTQKQNRFGKHCTGEGDNTTGRGQ